MVITFKMFLKQVVYLNADILLIPAFSVGKGMLHFDFTDL